MKSSLRFKESRQYIFINFQVMPEVLSIQIFLLPLFFLYYHSVLEEKKKGNIFRIKNLNDHFKAFSRQENRYPTASVTCSPIIILLTD